MKRFLLALLAVVLISFAFADKPHFGVGVEFVRGEIVPIAYYTQSFEIGQITFLESALFLAPTVEVMLTSYKSDPTFEGDVHLQLLLDTPILTLVLIPGYEFGPDSDGFSVRLMILVDL